MQFSMPLKQNHLFRRLYARGQSAANRHLVLYCRKTGSPVTGSAIRFRPKWDMQ